MSKKILSILLIGAAISGCQQISIKETSGAAKEVSQKALPNVKTTNDVLYIASPGDLKRSLHSLAIQSGLTLRYEAEPFMHKTKGAVSGTPTQIAQKLKGFQPLQIYSTGKELVVKQIWSLQPGNTLRSQLEAWDKKSVWKVVWSTRKNQKILASSLFYGSFDSVVEQVFRSLRNDGSDLEPEFYPNNTVVVK